MMAPKLRFSPGLKAKAHGAVIACLPAATPLVEILQAHRLNTRSSDGEGEDFFYLRGTFKYVIVILPTFWRSAPALKFSWQLARNFHSRRCSHICTDDPSTKTSVHCDHDCVWDWTSRSSFTAASSVVIFFHQAPPSPISSPSQPPPSFPSPSLLIRRNMLSARSPCSQKPSNVQLVPACVASGNIHNAVSRHLDKNRAKHRRTVFSMNKAQESKQRSTNWWRRHLGDMQQQPHRWQGFDKCEETKLRLDEYIRPWPPAHCGNLLLPASLMGINRGRTHIQIKGAILCLSGTHGHRTWTEKTTWLCFFFKI